MECRRVDARFVRAAAFASTEGRGEYAGIVGAKKFASTESRGKCARSVGAAAFASTEGKRADASIACSQRLLLLLLLKCVQ
jgi:hypothetical protein